MLTLILLSLAILQVTEAFVTTDERIISDGFNVEEHYVTTTDGYILKLFRIPCPGCPVVFFMHGLGSSSDFFVLNGCDNSLPYILANGNYDIWFGNARGNVYSRNHTTLSPDQRKFWAFSWHEIGKYDVPEIIDYILNNTSQTALHYIGHNQGATTFFVMLSEKPSYKNKIKACHVFAPIAYLNNSQSPLLSFLGPILGQPSEILNVLGSTELSYKNNYTNLICAEYSPLLSLCEDFLLLVVGPSIANLNQTLYPFFLDTHPSSGSTRQLFHYLQLYNSGRFCQYDFGNLGNKLRYNGSAIPPDYVRANIQLSGPINFYYGDNDYNSPVDVERFACELNNLGIQTRLNHYSSYNQIDWFLAINVRDVCFDCVYNSINKYENRSFANNTCELLTERFCS